MEEVSEHTKLGQGVAAGFAVSAMRGWSCCSMRRVHRARRADIDVGRRLTWAGAGEVGCQRREPSEAAIVLSGSPRSASILLE